MRTNSSHFHDLLTNISNEKTFLPRFSSNSEAPASKLLENLKVMFSKYYTDSDVQIFNRTLVLPVTKGLNILCNNKLTTHIRDLNQHSRH